MTVRKARHGVLVGLSLLALVLPGVGYAGADTVAPGVRAPALASGSIGAVNIVVDGTPQAIPPIAECQTGANQQASTPGVGVTDFVEFAAGSTRCRASVVAWTTTATVTGGTFRLPGLRRYGGPLIRLASYRVTCAITTSGTEARFQFTGLNGFLAPSTVPRNHVVMIPGPAGSPPLARVTLNELVTPTPPDGSVRLNLMRIRLFPTTPSAAPATGDIVVGSVHCDPS
ncbi:choice-of-anchor P family protein [Actinophytocola xanthii]|uniref:Uncharacterized protein n=1 Tax=Actinophytocola xanthii TaxID=1912961 RepID=A0A1Q8CT74_9PSEU|nr:choice-of-anchor P family protein [Actinophytocola xanthii]OLF17524.1 hypothetical protein BU204_11400 [Actinophytocola xanthii]